MNFSVRTFADYVNTVLLADIGRDDKAYVPGTRVSETTCWRWLIEHVWAAMKREMRARWGVDRLNKREGAGLSLDERVMNALGNVDVGTVQRYCRHSRVLAYLYQRGATGPLARFAAKWYTSHRPTAPKFLLEALPL